jgi:CheY-like chemotaxis protein
MSALRKVLVVDDDPVVGRSFDRVLSARGYAVITAESGQEALNKLGGEDYDVVFTDIRMPGMSGLDVAERVKARQPWLPVVIVTGYGTEANESRAEAAGVSGFLRKPLSPAMIEYSMRQALREKDAAAGPRAAAAAREASAAPPSVAAGRDSALKNVALFIAAPFVGLAYILAFPFVGLGMLAWMGAKAVARRRLPK